MILSITSRMRLLVGAALLLSIGLLRSAEPVATSNDVRFEAIHVYVDSGTKRLAAYQISIKARSGNVKIIGIEGGSHEAFSEPPYYDPKAIQKDHVILAAFSLKPDRELPSGETRVATIHYQSEGNDDVLFEFELQAAADPAGNKIQSKILMKKGKE